MGWENHVLLGVGGGGGGGGAGNGAGGGGGGAGVTGVDGRSNLCAFVKAVHLPWPGRNRLVHASTVCSKHVVECLGQG